MKQSDTGSAIAGHVTRATSGDRVPVKVAIVGCGNIAGPYASTLTAYQETELIGVADIDPARAAALSAKHGCRAYADYTELLADDDVEIVVNLSVHTAHYDLTRAALMAGKHVYSEKPLALTSEQAHDLVALAEARGRRLACSPFTFLGDAQRTAWSEVEEGSLGTVRLAYAEVNWGRIESWHPDPAAFYEVGALFDVGVYPLTLLTAMFGPARRVQAYGRVLKPDRTTKGGEAFTITTPDFVMAAVELESGVLVRLTTNFYVDQRSSQRGVELHGDLGSLHLSSWQEPNATVGVARFGEAYEPRGDHSAAQMRWGDGVLELARALREGRPSRVTGRHAAHVVDVLCAIRDSVADGEARDVTSSFTAPESPAGPVAV
ncbi:MAG TPA: Gfo/Idh/MocA family oxidoreductase [Trueperaceae bacterium]|nr:Gfo/Idh/MocA family oxidoreductase [Trueperaceae bacterium]